MCILSILYFYYLISYEKISKKCKKKKSLSDNSNIYFILELESLDSLFPYELSSFSFIQFLVHSLSRVQLFVIPWTAALQASLSITSSWSLLKLMSIESVMPSNHLLLCHPLLLLSSTFCSIRVFQSLIRNDF